MRKATGTTHEMSVFSELYGRLARLPTEKLVELIGQILPPGEIFSRMEGTLFALHFHGLRMFDLSAELLEAGIEKEDPRAEIFHQLQGGLVEKSIIAGARNISQREGTVCRGARGIMVWDGGKKCWYVPVSATSRFIEETDKLIASYAKFKEEKILAPYENLEKRGREIVINAAEKAWAALKRDGSGTMTKAAFLDQAEKLFEDRFPSRKEIEDGFHASRETKHKDVPEVVKVYLKEIRAAEQKLLEEETERARQEGEKHGEQRRLLEIEVQMQQERARQLVKENELRDQILREAMSPDVEKAKQIAARFYAETIKVGDEILNAARAGKPVHHATRDRWKRLIESLGAMEQTKSMREALDALQATSNMAGKDAIASASDIRRIEGMVDTALKDMARRIEIESNAANLWELVRNKKGESSLREIWRLRDTLKKEDEELEALLELMTDNA